MREGLIMLPQLTNEGASLGDVRQEAIAALLDKFGGATTRNVSGAWRDANGKLYVEPVWELVAAYEPTPENDAALLAIAQRLGHLAKQKAVYIRFANGEVQIINTETLH